MTQEKKNDPVAECMDDMLREVHRKHHDWFVQKHSAWVRRIATSELLNCNLIYFDKDCHAYRPTLFGYDKVYKEFSFVNSVEKYANQVSITDD